MGLYTRAQLAVLFTIVAVAGMGIAVGHWRHSHPELAARLERFDRAPTPFTPTVGDLPLASSRRPAADGAPAARASASKATGPLDVNRATEDELRALPGLGGVLAARIVEVRQREGPFTSLDDLRRVRGLGRAKLARLADTLTLAP
ncbi:MAG: helix-hairpin-helix domain-containing protein [Candidatus Rokubacteria bacterium]|nr:helix-hairpin-helix domain-containing protein [Candidatus Rokubacteria bacterium]